MSSEPSTCAHCGCEFVATHTPDYCDPCCRAAQIRCLKCNTAFLPPKKYPFGWCFDCARADPAHVPFRLPTHLTIGKEQKEADHQHFAVIAAQEKEAKEAKEAKQAEKTKAKRRERDALEAREEFLRQAEKREKTRERRQRRSAIEYLRRLYVRLCRQAIVTGKASAALLTARQIYLDAVEERYKLIGKLNDRIWRRIHNLPEHEEEAKPHAAPVPEADDWGDDDESWRPLFLRSHGSVRDEQRVEDAARYLEQWLPLWRERFELLQIRLLEEQDDERSAEPWATADEEPQEKPKITDALLKTFNNQWQPRA
ncbi:MAG: hypothetical protein AAAC47_21115 [Pararhizobium sp.]